MMKLINFKEERVKKGMTQTEVSDKSGLPYGTVRKMETGEHDSGFNNTLKYLNALGLNLKVVKK